MPFRRWGRADDRRQDGFTGGFVPPLENTAPRRGGCGGAGAPGGRRTGARGRSRDDFRRGPARPSVPGSRARRAAALPVLACRVGFDIEERDSALTVSVKCVQAGVPLMVHLVDTAATNPASIPAIVQDRSRRTYYGRDVPQQGRLIWPRPARDVVNFTRACDYLPFRSPWGHPVGHVGGRQVAVAKTTRTGEPCAARPGTVGDVVGRAVRVACADEWVLVHRVVMEGQLVDASCSLRPGQQFERENGGRE
ncbi:MAG: hypothetical protein DMD38_16305 [Gemmatimonadetes bacterium]|nr:MAG: hypothetical protein DMD38_16305 [Gemmatimonadota bacterium]